MRVLITLCLLGSVAAAQTALSSAQVAGQLNRAQAQIILVTPTLLSKPVAESLRRASAERGVEVFIVTSSAAAVTAGSYVTSLSLLPTVQIRFANSERHFALVDSGDNAFAIEGERLAQAEGAPDARPTVLLSDPADVAERGGIFAEMWPLAAPYLPFGSLPLEAL